MKTKASARTVPMGDVLAEALRQHRREQRAVRLKSPAWAGRDLVFTTSIGTAVEPRNINRQWSLICKRAGVEDARIHDLRHAFGTYLGDMGVSQKAIQTALRHARLSTTEIYIHAAVELNRGIADHMDKRVKSLRDAAGATRRESS
jgi:site-specific recombinase XerD